MPHPVDVAELKRAAVALHAGAFAMTSHTRLGMVGGDDLPAGLSLVVAGVAGGVGASTVALAIAAAEGVDRLWDAAPAVASGLGRVSLPCRGFSGRVRSRESDAGVDR